MRVAMFGPLRPELHHEPYSSIISGAMGYAAKQALLQKHNVIYDTNSNSVEHRKKMADIAIHTGALSVVVWVETPLQVAKERALVRDQIENDSEEVDISYIEIMAAKIEPPTANELVIKIDGTVSADQQKEIFIQQLEEIEGNI
jgi:predicted kinase